MKKIELDSIAIPQALDLAVEKGIQKGKEKLKRKKRRKIFFSTSAAAAVLLVFAGYCGANPAFAKELPLIGGIFQELQDKSRITGDWDQNGKNLSESLEAQEKSENEILQEMYEKYGDEAGNIRITPVEVYCDGTSLYLTLRLENLEEKGFGELLKRGETGEYVDMQIDGILQYKNLEQNFSVSMTVTQKDSRLVEGMVQIPFDQPVETKKDSGFQMAIQLLAWNDSSRTAQPEAFADMQDARYCLIGQQVWNLEIPVSIDGTRTQRYTIEQTGEKGFGLEEILVSPYDIKVKQIRPQMDSQENDTFYLECLKNLKEITGIDGYATYEEDKHLGLEHPLDSTLLAFDQDGEPLEWTASSGMEGYDVFSTKQKKITRLYLYQLPDFGGYTVMKDQENVRKLALFSYELEIREEP
ncbi:MAG TPA: DUF4179 domain-containing protein [Candidatus Blautia merdigallinarum]|uniref:DUF4179 domain-containing protein n=1 Tax=Candidatus Blautia merdigallinarum TaxID=2838495 RepID=A0A9D2SJK0_9FIRM|nr:DUF4179 domain-containing protein [Candidatus Blautia merdigallinarum]